MALSSLSNPADNGKPEDQASHILVIRLSAMGDVAMTVPVLSALTNHYPNLKITVLTKPFFEPMFTQLRNVKVFGAEVKGRHKGIFGLWKLYLELKALHLDGVADLHNVLRSKILKFFFFWSGISFYQLDKGRAQKKALTASRNKSFGPLKTSHERYADVFKKVGFPVDLSQVDFLLREKLSDKTLQLLGTNAPFSAAENKATSSSEAGIINENRAAHDLPPKNNRSDTNEVPVTKKWLGIAPLAAFEGKMYPLSLMAEVIRQLNESYNYKILLFGGGKKEEQQLQSLATRFECCVNVTGKLTFPEELALISNLDGMLSMDSGNGHLAAMYGIPVITLWGVTHPYAGFYPFAQDVNNAILADREKFPLIPTSVYGNKMPKGYEKAMETILPEDVVAKVEDVVFKRR